MNEFIEVTNKVIKERLDIALSNVEYTVIDGVLTIYVRFYDKKFDRKGFDFSYYKSNPKDNNLEKEFVEFVNELEIDKKVNE